MTEEIPLDRLVEMFCPPLDAALVAEIVQQANAADVLTVLSSMCNDELTSASDVYPASIAPPMLSHPQLIAKEQKIEEKVEEQVEEEIDFDALTAELIKPNDFSFGNNNYVNSNIVNPVNIALVVNSETSSESNDQEDTSSSEPSCDNHSYSFDLTSPNSELSDASESSFVMADLRLLQLIYPHLPEETLQSYLEEGAQGDVEMAIMLLDSSTEYQESPSMLSMPLEVLKEQTDAAQTMFPKADRTWLEAILASCNDFDVAVQLIQEMVPEDCVDAKILYDDKDNASEHQHKQQELERVYAGSVDSSVIAQLLKQNQYNVDQTKVMLRDVYNIYPPNRGKKKKKPLDLSETPAVSNVWATPAKPAVRQPAPKQLQPTRPAWSTPLSFSAAAAAPPPSSSSTLPSVSTSSSFPALSSSSSSQHNAKKKQSQHNESNNESVESHRSIISQYKEKRDEAFHRAAQEYNKGRRDVAAYYAQVGRQHQAKIRHAKSETKTTASTVKSRVPNGATLNTLDLHGLFVEEAIEQLIDILEQRQQRPQSQPLLVITGSGRHSPGAQPKIRPAVLKLLMERRIPIRWYNQGALYVFDNIADS